MAKQRKRAGGAATPAMTALQRAGLAFEVHEYHHDPAVTAFGEEAAVALGLPLDRLFKTLVAEVDGRLTVAVVPVSGQLSLKSLAAAVGGKRATMAQPRVAERATGYVLGGISPVGQRTTLPTVVDDSAMALPTVFVSGGRRGLDLELRPQDLVTVTQARTAPLRA